MADMSTCQLGSSAEWMKSNETTIHPDYQAITSSMMTVSHRPHHQRLEFVVMEMDLLSVVVMSLTELGRGRRRCFHFFSSHFVKFLLITSSITLCEIMFCPLVWRGGQV